MNSARLPPAPTEDKHRILNRLNFGGGSSHLRTLLRVETGKITRKWIERRRGTAWSSRKTAVLWHLEGLPGSTKREFVSWD